MARRGLALLVLLSAALAAPANAALGGMREATIRRDAAADVGGICLSCPSFDFGPFTPPRFPTCDQHAAVLVAGFSDCAWYQFNVIVGHRYQFSTCRCGGTAVFNTVLELFDPRTSCVTPLARNDNDGVECLGTGGSTIVFDATYTGVAHLRVRGFGAAEGGPYILSYTELGPCDAPSIASITPASGTVASSSCAPRTETFTVTLADLAYAALDWAIVPPAGGYATPSSGSVAAPGGVGTFTSTLSPPRCPGPARFTVQVTASRSCGSDTQSITYELRDVTPPRLSGCPPSRLQDCTLPVPPAPTLTATDNCDPAPQVVFTENLVPGGCPGNSSIVRTWVATDCSGNARRCIQNIVRRDRTPPTLSGTDTWCLHPPDRAYYCFATTDLSPTMTDVCSPPVSLRFVSCASSEPDLGTGPGDMPDDCIISPDGLQACLRAERAGDVVDRTYVVSGVARDACGNVSAPRPVAVVTVPHDDLPHPECRTSNSGTSVTW